MYPVRQAPLTASRTSFADIDVRDQLLAIHELAGE